MTLPEIPEDLKEVWDAHYKESYPGIIEQGVNNILSQTGGLNEESLAEVTSEWKDLINSTLEEARMFLKISKDPDTPEDSVLEWQLGVVSDLVRYCICVNVVESLNKDTIAQPPPTQLPGEAKEHYVERLKQYADTL